MNFRKKFPERGDVILVFAPDEFEIVLGDPQLAEDLPGNLGALGKIHRCYILSPNGVVRAVYVSEGCRVVV